MSYKKSKQNGINKQGYFKNDKTIYCTTLESFFQVPFNISKHLNVSKILTKKEALLIN